MAGEIVQGANLEDYNRPKGGVRQASPRQSTVTVEEVEDEEKPKTTEAGDVGCGMDVALGAKDKGSKGVELIEDGASSTDKRLNEHSLGGVISGTSVMYILCFCIICVLIMCVLMRT